MSTQILMPALSPTMTEGKLAKWLKKVGDEVHAGDVIAEIETDKATMEVEAVEEGKLARILVDEGTDAVAVNTPIAVLAADGEATGAVAPPAPAPTPKSAAAEPKVPAPAEAGAEARAEGRAEDTAAPAARGSEQRAPAAEAAPAPERDWGPTKPHARPRRPARRHGGGAARR